MGFKRPQVRLLSLGPSKTARKRLECWASGGFLRLKRVLIFIAFLCLNFDVTTGLLRILYMETAIKTVSRWRPVKS